LLNQSVMQRSISLLNGYNTLEKCTEKGSPA